MTITFLAVLAFIFFLFVLYENREDEKPTQQEPIQLSSDSPPTGGAETAGQESFFSRDSKEITQKDPIKLGFVGPLSGDAAKMGRDAQAAVAIAVEEINAAGGVSGHPLEVVYEDGKCRGADAINVAKKLISADKVSAILGGVCSEETLALADIAAQNKTVVLSSCSEAPAITGAGDYVFRNFPSDFFQGVFAADYLYETLGKRRAAVLYATVEWSVGVKDAFILHFTHLGSGVVALEEEYAAQDALNLREASTRIKAAQPDVVYVVADADASALILPQLKEFGPQAPIFGSNRWDDARLWTRVGSAGEGISFPVVSASPPDQFLRRMKAKTGRADIAVCAAAAYDGVKILAEVMQKTGAAGEAIKNELYQTVYKGSISSPKIAFDGDGDLTSARSYAVKVVQNGKAEMVR